MNKIKWIPFLLFLLAPTGHAALFSKKNAQTRGPALLDWNPNVRAESLGGAYVGLADDAGALYWNPAGMNQSTTSEIALSYAEEFGEQTKGDLSFVRPVWWGKERRTWGIRTAYSSVKPFDLTENGVTSESIQPKEYLLSASYEQPLGPVNAGATLKWVRQDIAVDAASTWAADVGVLGGGNRVRWGASLTNAGPALRTNTGSLDLPMHVRAGVRWIAMKKERPGSRDTLLTTIQLDAPVNDSPRPAAGVEYSRGWDNKMQLAGRIGVRSLSGDGDWMDRVTLGMGLSRNSFGFNYAYLSQGELGGTHRFDFSFRFGKPLDQEERRDERMDQAEDLFRQNRMVRARAAVAEALAISPGNHRGQRLLRKIDSRIADSLDPETLMILGDQSYSEGRYEQAEGYFRRLLEIDPQYPDGQERLDKAEEKAGEERLRAAETRLKEERSREDQSRRARAAKFMREKNWKAAIAEWGRVLALSPQDAASQNAIDRCRQDAYAAAVHAQESGDRKKAIQLFRDSSEGMRSYKDSQSRIDRLTELEEASAQKWYDLGMTAYGSKEFEKAKKSFERALEANPNDTKVLKALERLKKEMERQP